MSELKTTFRRQRSYNSSKKGKSSIRNREVEEVNKLYVIEVNVQRVNSHTLAHVLAYMGLPNMSQIVWAYIMTPTPSGVGHLISPRWLEEM